MSVSSLGKTLLGDACCCATHERLIKSETINITHEETLLHKDNKISTNNMGVKKQLQGHGDPLLMEVVVGLEETLTELREEKQLHGVRGVGERKFSNRGDTLFNEAERYHHQAEHDHHEALAQYLRRDKYNSLFNPIGNALFDPILEEYIIPHKTLKELNALEKDIADGKNITPHEGLLKRQKDNSLYSSRNGAMYDPVLQEYVLPGTSMLELKALKEDMIKKHHIFEEMKTRRDHNLENYEILCDPLVNSYRKTELLLKGIHTPSTFPICQFKTTPGVASPTKYRKLSQGDDLFKAFMDYQVTTE